MKKYCFHPKFKRPPTRFICLFLFYLISINISSKAFSATCTVASTGAAFGNYASNSGTPLDTAANIQVACIALVTETASYNILLGAGNASIYSSQAMSNGSSQLHYNLYTDAGHTSIWGDSSAGTNIVSDSYTLGVLLVARNYPVYGRIPINQNVSAGAYTDTVNVTVNY